MPRSARRFYGVLLAAASLAACAGTPIVERLDERAGMTLTSAREPLVFARTDPRYSRSARDYLYVGPFETNRQGVREYYLWVGVATTLDRGFVAAPQELPRTLYVTVEGEPIELELKPLDDLVRRTIDVPIYATAVKLQAELAARVTLQQLQRLATAAIDEVSVATLGGRSPRAYGLWTGGRALPDFVAAVER